MHNPPSLSDFEGDSEGYEKCLGCYEQGYIAVGDGLKSTDNP